MINIFLLSFVSSVYLISAGSFFYQKKNVNTADIYSSIFFGSAFLGFIALLLNFYLPLNTKVNTLVLLVILFVGLILAIKKQCLLKIFYCCIFISLISTLILSYDNVYRPDANLYHLPYTQIINENRIIFGISNVHFRFGHISILQYINAFFNNQLFKEIGILIPSAIIFSSFVLYFFNEIKENLEKNIVYTFFVFLLFAYILYGYNRYSEFGNDTIAHLFFFLICSYFLKDNYQKNINTLDFTKLLILSLFCFMLKTSLIFVFIFPLYVFLFNFKKEYIFNFSNIFIFLLAFSWIIKNVIVSGCVIYPIEITCFEKFQWEVTSNDPISPLIQSLDNEAWTKGWPDYKGEPVSQRQYVENFYWLFTWLSNHGLLIFKKILIFVIIILLLGLILKKNNSDENLFNVKPNKRLFILFLFSMLFVFIWFVRFPVFRYGSSYIVVLVISSSILIGIKYDIFNVKINKLKKYLNIILVIFFILFSLKHTLRIYKNYNSWLAEDAWPQFPKKSDTENISKKIILNKQFTYYLLKENNDGCGYTSSPCTPYPINKNIYQKEINGYKFFLIKK